MSQVGIIVGSRSDIEVAQRAAAVLGELEVDSEIRVISAHRAPDLLGRSWPEPPTEASAFHRDLPGLRRICPESWPPRRRCR